VEIGLRDGTTLAVRPLAPDDKQALSEGIEHLSPESRYRRFFVPVTRLGSRELTYLTDLDHDCHEALVAIDPDTDDGAAVARYVRDGDDPSVAEIALTVADQWQGRGLGKALLSQLAALARERGVTRFTGLVLAENRAIQALMRGLGPTTTRSADAGTVELSVQLDQTARSS